MQKTADILYRRWVNIPEQWVNIKQNGGSTWSRIYSLVYKDFKYTPVEKSLNNVTDILYDEIPKYRELTPLGRDFGKGVPI